METIQPFRDALASDWQLALERDEWFFSRLVDDIIARLSPSEAFTSLTEIATLLLQQVEPTLRYYCGTTFRHDRDAARTSTGLGFSHGCSARCAKHCRAVEPLVSFVMTTREPPNLDLWPNHALILTASIRRFVPEHSRTSDAPRIFTARFPR